jgi:stage IV sporulation protein FB
VLIVLFNSEPTPWDVRFRIFGFPVRVHPLCWLGLIVLGQSTLERGFQYLLIWVACGFGSILWHELGHAFMMRRFGSPASIVIHLFGGYARPEYTPTKALQRFVIAAAGPAAGLLVALAIGLLRYVVDFETLNPYLAFTLGILFFINLVWSILNLLPIWSMDGGRMLRESLVLRGHRFADMRTHQVSIALAALLVAVGLLFASSSRSVKLELIQAVPHWILYFIPSPLMCIFLGMMAFQNYQMLQYVSRPRIHQSDDRVPWER